MVVDSPKNSVASLICKLLADAMPVVRLRPRTNGLPALISTASSSLSAFANHSLTLLRASLLSTDLSTGRSGRRTTG